MDRKSLAQEVVAAVVAGACMHPDRAVRTACVAAIAGDRGPAAIERAVDSVRSLLMPFADDPLEPLTLSEEDFLAIALVQSLTMRRRMGASAALRVSSPDALDLTGGVEVIGLRSARAVPRRLEGGLPNHAQGRAFHPDLLKSWVASASAPITCAVRSLSVGQRAELRITVAGSGLGALRDAAEQVLGGAVPPVQCRAWFGSDPVIKPDAIARALLQSLHQNAVLLPAGTTLSSMGGLVSVTASEVVIQFRTAESILRLSAMASQDGVLRMSTLRRPWGWLVLGQGEDAIRFVRSAHAIPPLWLQRCSFVAIDVPPMLGEALSSWIGPILGCQIPLPSETSQ
jgi:hypothetical protein